MPTGGEDWAALALILLTTLLLGAAFIAIGMLVSVFTYRTASSLIVCMIVWVFLILVFPNAVGFLSSEFGFNEEGREFDRKLDELYDEYRAGMTLIRYMPVDYELMANTSRGGEGEAIFRIMGKNAIARMMALLPETLSAQNEFAARRFDLENNYFKSRSGKTALRDNLLRTSPSSLYGNVVNALARSDAANHWHFIEAARHYRDDVVEFIRSNGGYTSRRWFTNDVEDAPHADLVIQAEQMTLAEMGAAFQDPELIHQIFQWIKDIQADPSRRLDLSSMPRFTSSTLPLAEALGTAAFDLFLMITIIVIFFAISYIRFLGYDPR
jgi:hypothetical protein